LIAEQGVALKAEEGAAAARLWAHAQREEERKERGGDSGGGCCGSRPGKEPDEGEDWL